MGDYQHFILRNSDEFLTLQLIDPKLFDTATIMGLQDELFDVVDKAVPRNVIVDFSRVEHCSTAVINGLLRAKRKVAGRGGQLVLCGMTPAIRDAYKMLNLDGTVFQIHNTASEAAASF